MAWLIAPPFSLAQGAQWHSIWPEQHHPTEQARLLSASGSDAEPIKTTAVVPLG